ncbi:uncharacterized protein MAL13P1.304-like [Diaphorina citri]|uniref:Uncharacterized protein MAL13P1.304-like n=1 Tax=Diaphorina citri TaxID=121845 RepID=A0A3Q0IW89_DIACI|nr:uncharacterized protein MAL13P1.304-like [Diaphorina citri]
MAILFISYFMILHIIWISLFLAGNMDKLKLALKCTDIDTVDEMSRTALHFAITQRHTNIVWFLLNNKARMDIMDKDGFTAFHKAVQCGNTDCTHLMLERGADIDSTDDNGNTALHLATRQGYFNIAALLLKKGADLSIFNNQGEVPLHIATLGEHKELVSLLLKYGAAVNVPDRLQRTPLMLAARVGNIQLIHIFLQHGDGAAVNVPDRLQRTPLMLAARVGNIQLIHIFLQHGSHLDCCDSNGWTASDYAMIGGHQEIAKQLAQIPRPKTSMSTEKLDMLDTIGEDSELSDVDTSLDPNINNNSEVEHQIEVSIVSKKDISAHDSPLSCVTPPPLKPPRSWDLIQSGMIDTQNATVNNNTVQKRKSLTTLGSLESRRDSFVDNSNIASTPVEEPANDNGVIAENAMRNGTTTAENAMRNGTKAAENAMRGTEMGYSTEVACTGVVGEMKNIDGTDVGVHNKQPEEVTNVLDENNRNKGDSAKHMEDTNEDDIDTSLSSNSSSLLNELANNILVNQINKVVVDNQVSDDENVDTVNETGIAVVSGETVLGKTNDAKMESSRAGEAMEITRDVVKQGRAFFEKKTNSEEVLNNKNNSTTTNSSSNKNNNNNNTTTDSNNIAVKSKNTNEFAKDTEIVRAEELHLEPDSFVFNNERDEEIQMMILQNNLKEHRQFLIEKLDDVKSNEPCSSGMKSKELAEDSTKPDSNDGVETKEIESEQHVEKALCDLPKAIGRSETEKRDSFVDNSNIASTPVEEPANDNGVIAENAMRNGTTTAENAMRNGTTTAENAMRNGTKAAENAMRGTEMGYSTEVACTGVVGEMKNIDGTDVGVHNKQPEEVTNVLDENNRNKGDSAKHMEDTNEDDIDTSLSSNSSSLLNELANNILVNRINKVVVDNQVSDDENVDTVNETGIAVVSGETVLGKTNDAKMESSRAGEAMEITRDVVKQGRAFFEKKTNNEEVLNNSTTTIDSNNIAVKSKNTNEFAKDTEIVRAEELHLEADSFVFNNERDEEIQMMILQNNLKEHRQFLIEKLDDVKSNEPCSSGMKRKELAEDSNKHSPDSNDGVETIEIEPEQHVEKALRDLPKAIDEVKEDKRIHSGSEMNNQAPSDVDTDMKMVSASSNIADIPPSKLCDNFNSNPLMESIDTTCPPLSDTDAVHQYLASIQTDVSQSLESSNKVDSTVCSSCVGTTNESCDLMNKSCDYLINNIDQVLEHINSNANDVIQQNELLETHLSNELLFNA